LVSQIGDLLKPGAPGLTNRKRAYLSQLHRQLAAFPGDSLVASQLFLGAKERMVKNSTDSNEFLLTVGGKLRLTSPIERKAL
jgi:hypothetical protein